MHILGFTTETPSDLSADKTDCTPTNNQDFDFTGMNPFSSNPLNAVKEFGTKIASSMPIGKQSEEGGEAPLQDQSTPQGEVPQESQGSSGSFLDKMSSAISPVRNMVGSKVGGLFNQSPGAAGDMPSPEQQQQQQQQQFSAAGEDPAAYQQQPQYSEGAQPVNPDEQGMPIEEGGGSGLDKIKNFGAGILSYGKQAGGTVFESTTNAIGQIKTTVEDKISKR